MIVSIINSRYINVNGKVISIFDVAENKVPKGCRDFLYDVFYLLNCKSFGLQCLYN